MKYLSLFSGIEAASVAWDTLGWDAMAYAEIEPFPSAVLAHRFPDVPNLGDVTAVDWETWKSENGSPDVMIAGSPCQAFSVAGKRRSLEDARGNLSLFTAELVRFLEPRVFIWENVPGALNTPDNAFGCLLGELVGAGEPLKPPGGRWTDSGIVSGSEGRAAWRVLDAQYFGVAQRRRRVFVVRCPRDGADPAAILLECESLRRHTPPVREPRKGTAPGVGEGPALGGEVASTLTKRHDSSEDGTGRGTPIVIDQAQGQCICMAPAFSKRPGQQIATRDDGCSFAITTGEPPRVLEPLAFRKSQRAHHSEDGETWVDDGVANTLNAFDCGERDTHAIIHPEVADPITANEAKTYTHEGSENFMLHNCVMAFDGMNQSADEVHHSLRTGTDSGDCVVVPSIAFKPGQSASAHTLGAEEEVTPTLEGGGGGNNKPAVITPIAQVRRLTPTECERLQGFPDGWTDVPWRGKTGSADGPRYKSIGNSMAVPVIRWIGERIDQFA